MRPGDVVTRERTMARLGDLVTCKSLDNRAGVYVMIQAMGRSASTVRGVAAATTQEEVGLRGARVAPARIRPQIGLAIDITLANDGPGIKPHERVTTVGGGRASRCSTRARSCPPRSSTTCSGRRGARDPHQLEVMPRGGTDTRELQLSGEGAPAGCVSIPTRYVHQVVETCHPDDLDAAVGLVVAFCETAHELVPS